MKVIIISGSPATGKTTLAKAIQSKLKYELITKDQFKEKLFESDGRSNIIHNSWYENEAKSLFRSEIRDKINKNKSIIIESNFVPNKDKKHMAELLRNVDIVEIYCFANPWITLKRFISRNESGSSSKHPMHHDRMWYGQMFLIAIKVSFGFKNTFGALDLTDNTLWVNTNSFQDIDTEEIINHIEALF